MIGPRATTYVEYHMPEFPRNPIKVVRNRNLEAAFDEAPEGASAFRFFDIVEVRIIWQDRNLRLTSNRINISEWEPCWKVDEDE